MNSLACSQYWCDVNYVQYCTAPAPVTGTLHCVVVKFACTGYVECLVFPDVLGEAWTAFGQSVSAHIDALLKLEEDAAITLNWRVRVRVPYRNCCGFS